MVGKGRTSFGGQTLEDVIRCIKLVGFVECKARDIQKPHDLFSAERERLLVKNMPYTTIFGTPGRREYFIQSPEWVGELECKFQNTGGSVDEKMVYISETLKRTPLQRLVLVYGGMFWIKETRGIAIIKWLKREATTLRHTFNKHLLVFTLDEFISWVGKTWK